MFATHADFVWRALRRFGVREADLEDTCQEVFLVVYRRLPDFEGRASLRTWIYEIARRTALAQRRAAGSRFSSAAQSSELASDARTPELEVTARRSLAWLEAVLAQLDEDKREAFVLYELEEMTLAEVAAAVNAPVNTVHYRVQAARETIRVAGSRLKRLDEHAVESFLRRPKESP
ncbi:MAG: sigma-70 family RNA polymerase sigma factor [Myxococcales bacterium]